MMRVIASTGRKGGVGKTTTALALASMFKRSGLRVLVVDLDPQGSATVALGIEAEQAGALALAEGDAETITEADGVLVVPGAPDIEDLPPTTDLRAVLEIADADVVVIDTPPGHPHLERLALQAADVALVCAEAHRMAVAGAARVIADARTLDPGPKLALVVGRVDTRRTLDRTAPELLRGAFPGVPVFTVRQDSSLAGALNVGRLPHPGGNGWADLGVVFDWTTKKLEQGR